MFKVKILNDLDVYEIFSQLILELLDWMLINFISSVNVEYGSSLLTNIKKRRCDKIALWDFEEHQMKFWQFVI